MKSGDAKRVLEAARARATSMGKAVTIIVVDTAGVPVMLERVDDPPAFTAVVAEGKAAASAFTGRDSAQLEGMAENYPSLVSALSTRLGGRFLALQGAVVLTEDGDAAGAVGVSGATAEEDEEIARAGAAALGG